MGKKPQLFIAACTLKGLLFVSSYTKKKIFSERDNELAVCYAIHLKTGNINQTNSGVKTVYAYHNVGGTAFQSLRTLDFMTFGRRGS